MPATLGSVVEGILDHLYGHAAQQDAVTYLTQSITATDLSFTVDDPDPLGAGLIEVDTELMRVKNVDLTSNTVNVMPTGRGRRGSTAAAHAEGAEIRVAPIVPYHSVVREVNAEIQSLYPRLCAVTSTEFTATIDYTYELPADTDIVLDVRYKEAGGEWERLKAWEVEHGQNVTDFASGKTLRMSPPVASTVRVIYGKRFEQVSALTDTLADAGVPESCEDVIRMGVMLRLLPTLDLARLSVISVPSADANDKPPSPGTGIMIARELKQQYVARLVQEVGAFRLQYPARVHLTR